MGIFSTRNKIVQLVVGALSLAIVATLGYYRWYAPAPEGTSFKALGIQEFLERPPAPDFALNRIDGTEFRLSNLKGKVVFLNFFATWCGPCRVEMPEMEALYRGYKAKNFEMVAVSIDTTSAPLKSFANSLNLTFPIVHDPGMKVARQYGFRGPPLSYLIDRQGRIVGAALGPRSWNSSLAQNLVQKLLTEPVS